MRRQAGPPRVGLFRPGRHQGGAGPQGFANIKDGRFTTAVDGKGVRGGPYVVRVLGYDGKVGNELPFGNPLFDEYQMPQDLPRDDKELTFEIAGRKKK